MQGAPVPSIFSKLGAHILWGAAKKGNQKNNK